MSQVAGTNWTEAEIRVVIAEYLKMLGLELSHRHFVKADHNRAVQTATGRSKGSIEFKFQNISAVFASLGLPWIDGYVPMANFQKALLDEIEAALSGSSAFDIFQSPDRDGFSEDELLFLEPPPPPVTKAPLEIDVRLGRLIAKFDPAERDARNRVLGLKGEERVVHMERARLMSQRPDLASKVRWVSQEDGDGAGFDILSFEPSGEERLIEVKTTTGHERTPFFITSNEYAVSKERPDNFRLVRVFNFLRAPRAFELRAPLSPPLQLNTHIRQDSRRDSCLLINLSHYRACAI
ncbi:MAG: DUF3883 domain-containing protein [Parvularculaceae bacterium]